MNPTVLVTGPTGKVGRRLIPRLERRGATVRPASRQSAVRFDWADDTTYEPALAGADALYLVPGSIPLPWHADRFRELLAGTKAERVVLLSAYGVDQAPPDNGQRAIELAVEQSGVPYTILRPGAFMQNLSEQHPLRTVDSIRDHDEIRLPGGAGLVNWVSADDIAAVAAVALTEDDHDGRAYPILGPQPMAPAEVAGHISAAVGREIRYVPQDRDYVRRGLVTAGAPPEVAEEISHLYVAALTSGAFGATDDTVLRVTGAPPMPFAEFAAAAAAAWRPTR